MARSSTAGGTRSPRARRAKADPATSAKLANKASETGRAIGKVSLRMSKPIVRSIQQEEPKTLAKMVMAAVAPKLIEAGLRFALRNPATLIFGVAVVSAIAWTTMDESATA